MDLVQSVRSNIKCDSLCQCILNKKSSRNSFFSGGILSIRFSCTCGKQYRVADDYAGKKSKCKNCGEALIVPVPTAETKNSAPDAKPPKAKAARSPIIPTAPDPHVVQWKVIAHDGNEYGPVSREELDGWVEEGLLSESSQLLYEGQSQWQPAVNVYPQLAETSQAAGEEDDEEHVDYEPMLTPTGKKKTLGNLAMRGEIKKLTGATMLSSNVYRVGEPRSLLDRLKAGTIIGPIKVSEIGIDSLQLFHFRDAMGEFAAIIPFDNGSIAPIEFVARLPGCLPSPIVLMKQSGGKVALEAGAVMGGPIGKLLEHVGTKVESIWVGCDGTVPEIAQAAQSVPQLSQGIRWDGKIGGGPVSTIYKISWGIQALPLDDETFLLVAQSVPKQKMLGFEFGVPWFCGYRNQFAQFVAGANASQAGEFDFLDPGVWLSASIEALEWVEW